MRTQPENRTGIVRRQNNLASIAHMGVNKRRGGDPRSNVIDESKIYDTKTKVSEDYWETLSNIPSEDCHL